MPPSAAAPVVVPPAPQLDVVEQARLNYRAQMEERVNQRLAAERAKRGA